MAHSWQDLDSKVRTLESKIDFLMKSISVQQVGKVVDPISGKPSVRQMNLLDVWREVTTSGGLIETEKPIPLIPREEAIS